MMRDYGWSGLQRTGFLIGDTFIETSDGIIEDQDWHTYSLDVVFSGEACGEAAACQDPGPTACEDEATPGELLASGGAHSCAVQEDGLVRCWGYNGQGQATVHPDLGQAKAVTTGTWHSCGVSLDGSVHCWGYDRHGQATPPDDLEPAVAVTAGDAYSCAILESGKVHCWGRDRHSFLDVPPELEGVEQISASLAHTCARDAAGQVHCWGHAKYGKTEVPADLGPTRDVSAGWYHTCVVKEDGSVYCWGFDRYGQSGVPDDLGEAVRVSAGWGHTCALLADDSIRCWGANRYGESTAPADMDSAMVSASWWYTCGADRQGGVECWGDGRLGETAVPDDLLPLQLPMRAEDTSCTYTCGDACGNGVQDATETCDDGNRIDGDGCSSYCQLETDGDGNPIVAVPPECLGENPPLLAACDNCDAAIAADLQSITLAAGGAPGGIRVSGLVPNQRAVIQCAGLDERGNPSLPTAALEFSTLDTIPPQPLESARVSFRDHIADAATEVARLEWLVSADKPVYALEISDQNNLLEGLTVQLETEADTLWTRATQDNDTVEAFMLGDSITEGTLTLRAYDAEGNLVELDASITALLYTRRSVAEWFTPEVYVQGSWDDRPEEPTAAVTMEFAIVDPGQACRGFEDTASTVLSLGDAGFEPARFEVSLSALYPELNHADALGKRLCYRALATDEDGNTRGGHENSVPIPVLPLSAPEAPQASTITTSTAELSLVQHPSPTLGRCAAGLEVSYAYARLTLDTWQSGWTVPVDAEADCAATPLTLDQLIDDQLYAVSVRAIDADGVQAHRRRAPGSEPSVTSRRRPSRHRS